MNWTEEQVRRFNEMSGKEAVEAVAKVRKLRNLTRMNKWETEYAGELGKQLIAGEIRWYGFEMFKLRLASGTYYTPDFAVIGANGGLEFHEVKGFWRDDALVKFKVAAEHFPFLFIAMRKKKVSEGGGWEMIRYIKGGAGVCERVG